MRPLIQSGQFASSAIRRWKRRSSEVTGTSLIRDLIGYWPNQNRINSVHGKGGNIAVGGTVTYTPIKFSVPAPYYNNGGVYGVGVTDSWTNASDYNFSGCDFTAAFWYSGSNGLNTWDNTWTPCVMGSYTYNDRGNWAVWIIKWENRIALWANTNGSSGGDISASAPLPREWTPHLVVVWCNNTAKTINIQVDNGTIGSTTFTGNLYYKNYAPHFSCQPGGAMRFIGVVSHPMLWKNRVLTQAERSWLWNDGRGNRIPL